MKLLYKVQDKPPFGQLIVFALQQLLAILAATIAVPSIVGNGMSASAALFGAGAGTIIYLLFTKFKSPVFLGSSFAFITPLFAAFGGAASAAVGYAGILIGAILAGLVYVIIAIVIKCVGVNWIKKLMPPVVIGPTVALIGLSLASAAVKDAVGANAGAVTFDVDSTFHASFNMTSKGLICLLCALVTLLVVMLCSVFAKNEMIRTIPFVMGIGAGYALAAVFTVIGIATGNETFMIIDFSKFAHMTWIPDFTFLKAFEGLSGVTPAYLATVAVAYMPVAFVVFAEHIADHTNLSSIIEHNLIEDPGLSRTLLGDGVGSMVGAFFGGCPNTTYGESIGCVAISGNASVVTIFTTAIMAIIASFIAPFVTLLSTIPSCVMGGICISLYGFIAVSGLKMIQAVDLGDNRNLFVVSGILIMGIGDMCLMFGQIKITAIACGLIFGIIANAILGRKKSDKN